MPYVHPLDKCTSDASRKTCRSSTIELLLQNELERHRMNTAHVQNRLLIHPRSLPRAPSAGPSRPQTPARSQRQRVGCQPHTIAHKNLSPIIASTTTYGPNMTATRVGASSASLTSVCASAGALNHLLSCQSMRAYAMSHRRGLHAHAPPGWPGYLQCLHTLAGCSS